MERKIRNLFKREGGNEEGREGVKEEGKGERRTKVRRQDVM